MTLDEAAKQFQWSIIHDYGSEDLDDRGKIVAVYGLGIWEEDLKSLHSQIPNLRVIEKGRVNHNDDAWLRVDLHEIKSI